MEKVLLITVLAIGLLSCKKEEAPKPAPPKPCICEKQTWIRPRLTLPHQWQWNGYAEFFSNNCADNGRVVGGHSGTSYVLEYRIVCK
jgi:hypothetical protein